MQNHLCEYYSTIKQHNVEWLWYPYIPYGKLTVLQGDPGEGKSTFMLNIAALLTRGLPMPDGFSTGIPQSVIYQCAEDGLSDTIKPRLMTAGADCDRIAYIKENSDKLTLEDKRIENAIIETNARLLIIDPIQAFLTQDGDMQSAVRMRTILGRLSAIAEKHHCAIVLIGHMNKGTSGKSLYRGLGSIDIAAIARSILMIVRDPDKLEIRYMVPVKTSLAPEGGAIGFILGKDEGFQWMGPCRLDFYEYNDDTADPIMKFDLAKRSLFEMLSKQDMPSKAVQDRLLHLRIGERTMNAAKKSLNIVSYKKGKTWYWALPPDTDAYSTST